MTMKYRPITHSTALLSCLWALSFPAVTAAQSQTPPAATADVRASSLNEADNLLASSVESISDKAFDTALLQASQALAIYQSLEPGPLAEKADAREKIGLIHLIKRDPKPAFKQFKYARIIRSQLNGNGKNLQSAYATYMMAIALRQDRNLPEAMTHFESAIERAESSEEGTAHWLGNAYLQRGEILLHFKDVVAAHYVFIQGLDIELENGYQTGSVAAALNRHMRDNRPAFGGQVAAWERFFRKWRSLMARSPRDIPTLAAIEENWGNHHFYMNHPATALNDFQKALDLKLSYAYSETLSVASTLSRIATSHAALGNPNAALKHYLEALDLLTGDANTMNIVTADLKENIARIYTILGKADLAEPYLESALEYKQLLLGDEAVVLANTMRALARLSIERNEHEGAMQYAKEALQLEADSGVSAETYHLLSIIHDKLGEQTQALIRLQQAWHASMTEPEDRERRLLRVYLSLSRYWNEQAQHELAIHYASLAVNLVQESRVDWNNLNYQLQNGLLDGYRSAYLHLADLLIDRGRFVDAELVLALLKDSERTADHAYRGRGEDTVFPIDPQALKTSEDINAYFADEGRFRELDRQSGIQDLPASEQADNTPLPDVHDNQDFEGHLAAVMSIIDHLDSSTAPADTTQGRRTTSILRQMNLEEEEQAAVLYLFANGDRFIHLLITDKGPVVQRTRIDPRELNTHITGLRQAIRPDLSSVERMPPSDRTTFWKINQTDLLSHSQWLHERLIAPIQNAIDSSGAQTLVMYLDGSLRYLPMAALNDKKSGDYLIERYELARLIGPMKQAMRDAPNELPMPSLALGSNQKSVLPMHSGFTFYPLPDIESELNMVNNETIGPYATGAEMENFAWRIMNRGYQKADRVQTVIANAWEVIGSGNTLFMHQFYKHLGLPDSGRSHALRQAQLDMLNNVVLDGPGEKSWLAELIPDENVEEVFARKYAESLHERYGLSDHRHPYFWAPFILMGQWR